MKALSIQQPYAWQVIYGGKDIENRDWQTNHRGTIAVHAPIKRHSSSEFPRGSLRPPEEELGFQSIIGFVDIVDCVEKHHSKWRGSAGYGFVLENPRPLLKPIPCVGAQKFWEVPANVLRRCKIATRTSSKSGLKLRTFQYGTAPKRGQGLRIGTARFQPLRVPKDEWCDYFDVWFRVLAPTAKLVHRMKQETVSYTEFCVQYERELLSKVESRQALDLLAAMAQRTPISVGCYCEDESLCHRTHLKNLIERAARKLKSGGIQK